MDNQNAISIETDIDIDTPDRERLLSLFNNVPATIHQKDRLKKHNTGVYFHKVPVNPYNGYCSLDYKTASKDGFFKLDILNVSIYKDVLSNEHLNDLMEREPIWELLQEKDFCDLLFHLKGHHGVCEVMKPDSILKLAAVLSMIRPAKRHLIGLQWDDILKEVWTKPLNESYYFKKSHAISYAFAVVVHMNLICEQLVNSSN